MIDTSRKTKSLMWTFPYTDKTMKLRSGFEYVYRPIVHSARTSSWKRSVEWRRFVKSHRLMIRRCFHPRARIDRIVPELTRFMIKCTRSRSKAHWTEMWATQALARRFSSGVSEAVPQKLLPRLEEGLRFIGSPFDRYSWKAGVLETLSVGNKPVPYRHLGFDVDDDEWALDDQTPFLADDYANRLSSPKRCAIPCFCRLHVPDVGKLVHGCVTCENYAAVTASAVSLKEWSYMLSGFESHAAYCKSTRARRYRGWKRSHEEWGPGCYVMVGARPWNDIPELGRKQDFFY